jgi:cell cycle checkpoint control protein RAD9A
MHIVISVKDFKAIVTHAETLRGAISANFSFPTRPLQFTYQSLGMHSEFTLMTTGDYRGASSTPQPNFVTTRSSSRQPSIAPVAAPSRTASEMAPPPRPVTVKPPASQSQRMSLKESMRQAPAREADPDPDPDSLFLPGGDDDQTWDPPNYENEEEMLGWDASNEDPSASFHPTFRDSGTAARSSKPAPPPTYATQDGLEPTQRLSQVELSPIYSYRFGILSSVAARHVRLNRPHRQFLQRVTLRSRQSSSHIQQTALSLCR